ncbi:hypothetical protein C7C46_08985 [Streptomyces tateyamensis]|uniref:Uncharacterized protein n=1 Tax=Streptomyces tateyamensis TaxID=565073 RepID=A0A2V4P116_9ACTN|nr:hypothetical protein [Streptomyces tateyamensis]PYC83457.1 hypothetical protein C7C46_08985 [Streptomyces tateyamensis]
MPRPAAKPLSPAAKPLTFAQMRERISRPRRTVPLVLDAEAAAETETLATLLERAVLHDQATGAGTARAIAELLQAAEQRAQASRVDLVLQAVPHTAYRDLRREHPPTREQLERAAKANQGEPAFDPDTFAPALVHAQLLSPRPDSAQEFDAWWSELSDGQLAAAWSAALAVQLQYAEPVPSVLAADVIANSPGSTPGTH